MHFFNLLHLWPFLLFVHSNCIISPSITNLHDLYLNWHLFHPYCIVHHHVQTWCKNFQGRYGRLQLGNVYTCHGYFQRMCELENQFQNIFSQIYLKDLLTKDLVTFSNLIWKKNHETSKRTICNSRQANLGATRI